MDTEVTKNLIQQIESVWVAPEVARRNFNEPIFAVLIVFKQDKTEILFNNETKIIIEIDPTVGGKLTPGKPVTAEEFSKHKIKNIKIPEDVFNNYPFISAIIFNNQWTIYFNFVRNKKEAQEKIELAEQFIKAAESVDNEKVKAYNLYQALEFAVQATLLSHPVHETIIKKSKTHATTKSLVNLESRTGFIPIEISDLFNKLARLRPKVYSSGSEIIPIEGSIQIVKNYISIRKKSIYQT